MAILLTKKNRVIVQGFTGGEGTFHAGQMIEYGTNIVGGVTPGKGGTQHLERPVFDCVSDAVQELQADTSIIFVPPPFAADAILEAIEAGIKLIVTITEGIPTRDMVPVKAALNASGAVMIGPNCPGLITPGQAKLGILPGFIHSPGPVGVISRSGTAVLSEAPTAIRSRPPAPAQGSGPGSSPARGHQFRVTPPGSPPAPNGPRRRSPKG